MRRRFTALALAAVVTGGGACRDGAFVPTGAHDVEGGVHHSALSAGDGGSAVARALARAMDRPEVRVLVRDAMRGSRVTEHKLVLARFLATPVGRRVLAAAATAEGGSPGAVLARVEGLPELDFYAPFREHRTTWRAGADVLVGYAADPSSPVLTAFRTDGSPVSIDLSRGVPPEALLLLHPAERKGLRIDPQPEGPGAVIQDPGDGELSGSLEWVDARGRTHRVAFGGSGVAGGTATTTAVSCDATALESCEPSLETSYPGQEPADTTLVDYLWINYTDHNGAGTAEVELRAEFYSGGALV